MTRLPILALLLLSACAGCQHPPVEGPVADHLPDVIAALAIAGPSALVARDQAAGNGNEAACAAWGSVAIAAPVLADSLAQVASGTRLDHLPALSGSLAVCDLPAVEVPAQVEQVAGYVLAGLGSVRALVTAYAPQLQAQHCEAFAVASTAADYAGVLAPAVLAGLSTWSLDVAAVPVDYGACPVEAVAAIAPAG